MCTERFWEASTGSIFHYIVYSVLINNYIFYFVHTRSNMILRICKRAKKKNNTDVNKIILIFYHRHRVGWNTIFILKDLNIWFFALCRNCWIRHTVIILWNFYERFLSKYKILLSFLLMNFAIPQNDTNIKLTNEYVLAL